MTGRSNNKSGISMFREGLACLHIQDQKNLFNNMNPELRLALWQDRVMSANEDSNSEEQKSLLNDLYESLSLDLYSEKNEKALKTFQSHWSEKWDRLFEVFDGGSDKLTHIMTTLSESKTTKRITPPPPLPECTCASANNGDFHNNDCGGMSNACETGSCTVQSWGCGYFWLQSCDGLCTGSHFQG